MTTNRNIRVTRRWAVAAVLVAASAAGCTSTPHTGASGGGTGSATDVKTQWLHCMAQHGVTVPSGNTSINPQSIPGFNKALNACRRYEAQGQTGPGQTQASQHLLAQILRWTHCMRAHGVPLPDPKSPTGGNVSQSVPIPMSTSDPRFVAATNACRTYQPQGAVSQIGGGQ
jgi:hypothetical protein